MFPYRPSAPEQKRSFLFGAERALGSLVLLAVAYVLGILVTGSHEGVIHELSGISENPWNSLLFWVVTGLFWLTGGITAIIFWPIFLAHIVIRVARKFLG